MSEKIMSWNEIRSRAGVPEWLRECKFGIYTHWGVYSVHGCGPNTTWYSNRLYEGDESALKVHRTLFGELKDFGYTDFIPRFTAEKFDAEAWAELFKKAGAGFAGPVAEHHDGFSMWPTKYGRMNAGAMGPKRDVVGELEKAIRGSGMRFMTALHHAENYWFLKKVPGTDSMKPEFEEMFDKTALWPKEKFYDRWLGKACELIDLYSPDLMWFDFGLKEVPDEYKRRFFTHYFNHASQTGQDVCVTYKFTDLVPGSGLIDIELGSFRDARYHEWITDTTVDDGQAWGWMRDAGYKTSARLIDYLIDNVSKNGYFLLNVGPKADGTIPPEAEKLLLEIGAWLKVNGEAIYGTTPWYEAGEGPTVPEKEGMFAEHDKVEYTAEDLRYTCREDAVYAMTLASPGSEITLHKLLPYVLPARLGRVTLLSDEKMPLQTVIDGDALTVRPPENAKFPCGSCALKIELKNS